MPMFFLLPLVAGIATGYISNKCQDEVAYLTGTFTVLSLVLSIVLAPWQIQALLLIVVLASTNKFLRRN
ncbi:hypothetical protein [Anabaena azotica]|uniref:SxtJ n=1 Tax=Anabaena azotica FACHB-119 TaxID=947527 RepID=A0ABR8D5L6_9NOST|nr:hypothetical protein [Anabaena azotica]MBD2501532.1 hypothetical protein [Anabaena azotica FACHB-119]